MRSYTVDLAPESPYATYSFDKIGFVRQVPRCVPSGLFAVEGKPSIVELSER